MGLNEAKGQLLSHGRPSGCSFLQSEIIGWESTDRGDLHSCLQMAVRLKPPAPDNCSGPRLNHQCTMVPYFGGEIFPDSFTGNIEMGLGGEHESGLVS